MLKTACSFVEDRILLSANGFEAEFAFSLPFVRSPVTSISRDRLGALSGSVAEVGAAMIATPLGRPASRSKLSWEGMKSEDRRSESPLVPGEP